MTLSAAEKILTDADTGLTGLATLLDIERLNLLLANETSSGVTILARHYIRYKFGTNCLVSYSGIIAGQPVRIYAKGYGADFEEKALKIAARANQDWDAHCEGKNLWVVPALRIVIRSFPADGKLRALKVLYEPASARRFLNRILGKRAGEFDTDYSELAYKPERRLVVKVRAADGRHAVIKFYGRHAFERSRRNLAYLKKIRYRNLPRLIGRSRRRTALAFEWHAGDTFRERAGAGRPLALEASLVGQALADLHSLSPGNELDCWKPEEEFRRLRMLSRTLTELVPHRRHCILEVMQRVTAAIATTLSRNTLLHGDFHSRQILLCDGGIRFLDVDELCAGPAELDVGTFVAHVNRDALRGFLSRDVADSIVAGFLSGYESSGGVTENVSAYTALSLLRFSHHPFRACENDWDRSIEKIIDLMLEVTANDKPLSQVGGI